MRKIFLFFTCISCALFSAPQPLKYQDVRNTLEEIFSYHVEQKELNPVLVKRSCKSFIEQFDSQKIYLLQSEVKNYIDLTSTQIELTIDSYFEDRFPLYEELGAIMAKSIARAQALRREIISEILNDNSPVTRLSTDSGNQWATSTGELKARLKSQLVRLMLSESRSLDPTYWTHERKQKILSLYDKRFFRFEQTYAPNEHYLTQHLLKALARSLDAHTAYFSPQEAFEMRAALEKQFEGIGVVLREDADGIAIADLVKGGPAHRCGQIKVGDFLVEIDGRSVVTASYEDILELLKGDGRREVTLALKRGDPQSLYRVDLKREQILMEDDRLTYSYEPFADGIIGKLTLPSFYESSGAPSCEADIREALRELKKQGKLVGLVLDMRENLGGFLSQAVKVSGLFISSGVVVISKYAQGEVQYLRNVDPRLYYNGPFIILTSKASASAAEIVAQALQDYGVALVVGDERTYGKGTIQYQTVTDNKALSFFKVTVGRYYTVSGRSTQIEGVKADILVPSVFAPYNIGEKYLEFPLHNDQVASVYNDPLTDVDGQSKLWLQKNYLPFIQKKESKWVKMLPKLQAGSEYRQQHDPNFKLFLDHIKPGAVRLENGPSWGIEDLQMAEAVNIVKDMIMLHG